MLFCELFKSVTSLPVIGLAGLARLVEGRLRKSPRDDSKQHSCLDKQTARRKGGEVVTAVQDWEGALEELNKLKDAIDSNTFVPVLEQLQQRSWLMHWGLYIFFNHENGRNLIIDYLFQDRCRPQP